MIVTTAEVSLLKMAAIAAAVLIIRWIVEKSIRR